MHKIQNVVYVDSPSGAHLLEGFYVPIQIPPLPPIGVLNILASLSNGFFQKCMEEGVINICLNE
ncbi:MAG: hypothetical protein WAM14_14080 [Candidatus Nitrosopolaris sp.]